MVEVLLGSAPFVPVMQPVDLGNRNNLADGLHPTRIRRILIQGHAVRRDRILRCVRKTGIPEAEKRSKRSRPEKPIRLGLASEINSHQLSPLIEINEGLRPPSHC